LDFQALQTVVLNWQYYNIYTFGYRLKHMKMTLN